MEMLLLCLQVSRTLFWAKQTKETVFLTVACQVSNTVGKKA